MQNNELEPEAQDVAAQTESKASAESIRRRFFPLRRMAGTIRLAVLAFSLGLGVGYLLWGQTNSTPLTATQPSGISPESSAASPGNVIDVAALSRQVNPPEGYALPATFGDIGPRLLAAGGIDFDRFAQLYAQAGQPLSDEQIAVLKEGRDAPIVIDRDNASFLLNVFWAVGLTNRNRILTEGPMMQGGMEQVGNFASTGGWTMGRKPPTDLYASASLIALTPEQQLRLEEVAQNVYRPCCDNPTHFPDCNHGMAMLGLLEVMASQGATTDEMFEAAKYINAFWYPQQTLEQAVLFKAARGLDFEQVEPREVVGIRYSSASGYRAVRKLLADNGLLGSPAQGGGGCGVQP